MNETNDVGYVLAPISDIVLFEVSCPVCHRQPLSMRYDFSLFPHGPHGNRCRGDSELMLTRWLRAYEMDVRPDAPRRKGGE